jgi:hypothetical protein
MRLRKNGHAHNSLTVNIDSRSVLVKYIIAKCFRATFWDDPNLLERAPACGLARIGKCVEPALLLG